MNRTRLPLLLAAVVAWTAVAARGVPGDPTDGQNPLDEVVRPLGELNLRPDFELTVDQKRKVQAIRARYAAQLAQWRAAHAADFQQQVKQWEAMRAGRPQPGGGRPTEQWHQLQEQRQRLLSSSPDPTDAQVQIEQVLTPDQRKRYDAVSNRDLAGRGVPTAPFASEVLPLPADGVPRAPGFYKLRITAQVPGDNGGATHPMRMTYVLFLPHDYDPTKGPYPALVFLHGSGEVGTDGNGIFALGPAAYLRQRAGTKFATDFPMILVCPQCPPRGERWDQTPVLKAALQVLDDAAAKVRVDPDRVYVTGLSMGGKGTWLLAGQDPDRFAGIAPIASSTLDLPLARRLRYLSVWAINGSEDIEDGADHARQMAAADADAGGDAEATTLKGRGHDVWDDYYGDLKFYQRLLTRRRLTAAERQQRDASPRPATRPATRLSR